MKELRTNFTKLKIEKKMDTFATKKKKHSTPLPTMRALPAVPCGQINIIYKRVLPASVATSP